MSGARITVIVLTESGDEQETEVLSSDSVVGALQSTVGGPSPGSWLQVEFGGDALAEETTFEELGAEDGARFTVREHSFNPDEFKLVSIRDPRGTARGYYCVEYRGRQFPQPEGTLPNEWSFSSGGHKEGCWDIRVVACSFELRGGDEVWALGTLQIKERGDWANSDEQKPLAALVMPSFRAAAR